VKLLDRLSALLQALLPQHTLARVVYVLARARTRWLKNLLIRAFVRAFAVDLGDAEHTEPTAYPTFNAFFTRALRPAARPLPASPELLACPVDGTVSQAGEIDGDRLFQAKGQRYALRALLADDAALAAQFGDGSFATIYLAPHNYHRIHMPAAGTLREMIYVPGRLYSVNAGTERAIAGLFARNERVLCLFDTAAGPLAVVLVGALIVGSMQTAWHGEVRAAPRQIRRWSYAEPRPQLGRGAELGRFNVGSTVILLYGPGRVQWDPAIRAGAPVRLGQVLGRCSDS
jgi:phosphatidylserine decarboxylase